MEPQVFFSVCYNDKAPSHDIKARHTFSPAVLHDYCRHRVQGADYPGMIEDAGHSVFGMVVSGITKSNLERLDFLSVLFLHSPNLRTGESPSREPKPHHPLPCAH